MVVKAAVKPGNKPGDKAAIKVAIKVSCAVALAALGAIPGGAAWAQGGSGAVAAPATSASAPAAAGSTPDAAASAASAPLPLHVAVRFDHGREVMKLLLEGADPNARDAQRNTALHVALRESSDNAFTALLKSPQTDVNAINQAGETPLMLAALKGRLDWVKALVERGAHVNEAGWSPLHYGASGPNEAVVRWLVEKGADLNARSPNGTTPLMMAAGYGGLSSVEILLAANADVRLKNDVGFTAADFARRAGQDDLARKLDGIAANGVRAKGHPVEPSR